MRAFPPKIRVIVLFLYSVPFEVYTSTSTCAAKRRTIARNDVPRSRVERDGEDRRPEGRLREVNQR